MASLGVDCLGRCWQSAPLSPFWAPVPTGIPNDRQASPPAVLRAGHRDADWPEPRPRLGEAGVPVIGIATGDKAIGLQVPLSRHGEIPGRPRTDAGLAELRAIGERYGAGYLLTVSEANTTWLIENRDRLGVITPLLPSKDAFAIVLDKGRTLEAAAAVGIDVPKSASPATWADVERVAASFLRVLQVVRPQRCGAGASRGGHRVGEGRIRLYGRRVPACGRAPAGGNVAAGAGNTAPAWVLGSSSSCTKARPCGASAPAGGRSGRRGGFSSVATGCRWISSWICRRSPSACSSRSAGRAWRWSSTATTRPQRPRVLMEVNGRFWGSFPRHVQRRRFWPAGLQPAGQGVMPSLPACARTCAAGWWPPRSSGCGASCCNQGRSRDRTFQVRPVREVLRFVGDFLRPSVCYYVWNAKDVKPFIRDDEERAGHLIQVAPSGVWQMYATQKQPGGNPAVFHGGLRALPPGRDQRPKWALTRVMH